MLRNVVVMIAGTALLSSCHAQPAKREKPPGTHAGAHAKPSDEVLARRRAMGRWRSLPHSLPGTSDRWMIVDLAGSGDVRIEIRNQGVRGPAVSSFAVGRYQLTPTGILGWTKASGAGTLGDFAWFHATFPSSAAMVLHSDKSGGGPVVRMTYDGV